MMKLSRVCSNRALCLLGALLAAALWCNRANASLVGDSIGIVEYYPTLGTVFGSPAPQQVIQPSGNTFSNIGLADYTIAIDASTITLNPIILDYTDLSATFNGVEITDYNSLNTITNASLDATSLSLPSGFLYFDSHDIFVNTEDVDLTSPIVIDVSSSAVPEPASLSLLGLGALALLGHRRRSKAPVSGLQWPAGPLGKVR